MEKVKNKRIIFDLPKETTTAGVIKMILENNGLKEDAREYLEKSKRGEETRLAIIRDAAFTMVQKKIPEKKLIELLVKHLKTSNENATNVVSDIKKELIPYADTIDMNAIEKGDFQEELLNKIKSNTPQLKPEIESEKTLPYNKKPQITNVDKNAENMEKEARNVTTKEKSKFLKKSEESKITQIQETKIDSYREPVE